MRRCQAYKSLCGGFPRRYFRSIQMSSQSRPTQCIWKHRAFNVEIDENLAREIREFRSPTDGETRMFCEIVVAPKCSEEGLEVVRGKSKMLRILEAKKNEKGKLSLRQVRGGWLAQDSDDCNSRRHPIQCGLGDNSAR